MKKTIGVGGHHSIGQPNIGHGGGLTCGHGGHAIVATDKSNKEGTEGVPMAVLDSPQAGGIKAASETGVEC